MTAIAVQPGQRRRRFGVLAILAILLLLGACTGLDLWAGHRVETEIARLEARYGSMGEAGMLVPPVPAADNRARIVRAAAALTVPAANEVQPSVSRFLSQRASSPVPAELRTFVDANRPALRVAGDALTRRQSNWDVDYQRGSDGPPWMEIRTLSQAIYLASRLDLEAGRPDDAAKTIASGLAVSASLRQESNLLAQLMRVAVASQQFDAVRRLVIEAEPSKASLEELARGLAENRVPDPMQIGLRGELQHVHAVLTRMENGRVERDIGQYLYPESWPPVRSSWYGPLARLGRPVVRLAHARYLRRMGHLLEVQAGARPRPAFPPAGAPPRWALIERLAGSFTAGIERSIETGDYFTSELGATEVAIALRRFKLDHGVYPDTLAAVVPVYLSHLPIDAFTGRPPAYARQGLGFTLLAKGPRPEVAAWRALEWNVEK